jgi:hypothetical protein
LKKYKKEMLWIKESSHEAKKIIIIFKTQVEEEITIEEVLRVHLKEKENICHNL